MRRYDWRDDGTVPDMVRQCRQACSAIPGLSHFPPHSRLTPHREKTTLAPSTLTTRTPLNPSRQSPPSQLPSPFIRRWAASSLAVDWRQQEFQQTAATSSASCPRQQHRLPRRMPRGALPRDPQQPHGRPRAALMCMASMAPQASKCALVKVC